MFVGITKKRTSSRNCKIAIPEEMQFFIRPSVVMVVRPNNTNTITTTTTTTATTTAATAATASTSLKVIMFVGIAKSNFLKELQNRNSLRITILK